MAGYRREERRIKGLVPRNRARRLLAFELQQANGLSPIRTLDSVTDASIPAPGLGLSLGRVYANSIAGHYQTGPFGRGW